MSDIVKPTGLQIKTNDLIRVGKIAWLDQFERPFAYTDFGDPCPPRGRAAYIVVHPESYDEAIQAIESGLIVF